MGIQLQNIKSGVSVDNIVLDATYEFTARDVKLLPNFPFKIEDKVECLHKVAVKQLKEELSREEKVTLDVIQQHFLYQLASGGYTVIRKHELEELKESAKEADSVKIDAEKFAQEIIRQVKKQGCSF
jgi:hypothetical protein